MAKQKNAAKSTKKKSRDVEQPDNVAVSSMSPDTLRGVIGVVLFVLAIVLILSAIGLAGVAGNKLHNAVYWLVGLGYYLVPLMLMGVALALFRKSFAENGVQPIRAVGGGLFFVSALGMIAVLSPEHAGMVGRMLAWPLVTYLEQIASLVVLTGVLLIALLLLFDSELWVRLFARMRTSSSPAEEDVPVDGTELAADGPIEGTAETTHDAPAPAMPVEEPAVEEQVPEVIDEDEEYGDLFMPEQSTPSTASDKQKSVPLFTAYTPPPLSLLEDDRGKASVGDTKGRSNIIRRTLQHFKIPVEMDEITVGPTVTRYALKPAEGVKLSRITALRPNLELALSASPIRIEAPIPNRALVGIEVPNAQRSIVGLAGLLSSPTFLETSKPLMFALGKDIAAGMHYADIAEMPHLLIAGATKSGKSVMVHTLITSLLYKNGPDRLRLIIVDPKQVEGTLYDGLPHLCTPIITDAKKCILALGWAGKEMERRYDTLREHRVRDIGEYHSTVLAPALEERTKQKDKLLAKGMTDEEAETQLNSEAPVPDTMPLIVVIIDELADIMQAYPRELESAIVKLAQKSRAVGIHLVLSTQSPRAEVVTGLIKANIPARLALKVSGGTESRIILDDMGAEQLLGNGDMLWKSPDMGKPQRLQAPFLTTSEVKKIVAHITKTNDVLGEDVMVELAGEGSLESGSMSGQDDGEIDALYDEVRIMVVNERKASTSFIQRKFRIGYGRAARIMDQLEQNGVIAPSDGTNRPREILEGQAGTESDEVETYENDRTGAPPYER